MDDAKPTGMSALPVSVDSLPRSHETRLQGIGAYASESPEFDDVDFPGSAGDQIAQRVGTVIAADAFLVRIHFEDVLRTAGIVLEGGETLDQSRTAAMNEERGWDAGVRITEAFEDFGPAVDAVPADLTEGSPLFLSDLITGHEPKQVNARFSTETPRTQRFCKTAGSVSSKAPR